MLSPDRLKIWISNIFTLCAAILLGLYITLPEDASPEYRYTVTLLSQWIFPFVLLVALATRTSVIRFFLSLYRRWKIVAIVGAILLIVPFIAPPAGQLPWLVGYMLSCCWMLGTFCAAIAFFAVAAKINNLFSGLLCLIGSLALAFSFMEGYLLVTPQPQDALLDDSRHSKYVLSNQAVPQGENVSTTAIGTFPEATGSSVFTAHRTLKFDRELFDVRYGFDAQGRRVTPTSDARPQAELLLFGCSYTFGHGLEDQETWAWKLGKLLGPKWQVSNYAFSGFGPQQMLTLLEEGKVDISPAPKRVALFLTIYDHIYRNAGLTLYQPGVRYTLRDDGRLERDGFTTDSPFAALFLLPRYFNGSQIMRDLPYLINTFVRKRNDDIYRETYLEIVETSARLLLEKYNIHLTVLLWPSIEFIEADLHKHGIATLCARDMFPNWNSSEEQYYIDPSCEKHPNSRATSELAEGLAAYFRPLLMRETQ